jgi:hypothetical protein
VAGAEQGIGGKGGATTSLAVEEIRTAGQDGKPGTIDGPGSSGTAGASSSFTGDGGAGGTALFPSGRPGDDGFVEIIPLECGC